MSDNVYGREDDINRIKKYAESDMVGNQAFLGVKGVGKTVLFQSYFTKKKRGEIAQNYKKLFVFSQLDSRKQGSDLYKFLIDQVKIGIMGIPDKDTKNDIKLEMKEIDEIFETPDGRLIQYLTVIKEAGYDLIIIMDQFHCMARDTEIGLEQYDVLRSLNEQKLITYWIITDTDLMETCASEQYIASFFAQKFTRKITIKPLEDYARKETIELFLNQKKIVLEENEKLLIADASGGIPELMSILIDLLALSKSEGKDMSLNSLVDLAITHSGCVSLFEGWISGLDHNQKKMLYDVATAENGIQRNDLIPCKFNKIAELADEVGRGLLFVTGADDNKRWDINTYIFKKYIVSKGESFCQEDTASLVKGNEQAVNPHVTNVFHISGHYIQNQTNNVLNIENAVTGLEDLHRLVYRNPILLDENQAMGKLEYLPFKQEVWHEMDAQEQEKELEKYADGIFSSEIFSRDLLTQEQMQAFSLTEELLGSLYDSCRTQVICGVQVYNLIQLCIDNFGLSMDESESPRGILFARAFERHLKDFMAPAFLNVPELAERKVYPTTTAFKNYPLDKTTIGTYSSILDHGYPIFAQASTQLLGRTDRNQTWWKMLVERLRKIGDLRNKCCHSGTTFDGEKLSALIDRIFLQKSLDDILIFAEIPVLQKNHFSQSAVQYQSPVYSMIGKTVDFKILSKGNNGNFKGIINGNYEASLPKRFAVTMNYVSVKGMTIRAVIDKIQDNKYVLRL